MSSVDETKQMLIRVPKDIFKEVKRCAYMRNITMRQWVIRELQHGILRDTKYDNELADCEIHALETDLHCTKCHKDCNCLHYTK